MALKAQQVEFLLSENAAIAGGTATFYTAGSSHADADKKTIWQDRNKTTPAANPVTLDAVKGTATVFADGVYDVVLKNAAGVTASSLTNIEIASKTSTTFYDVALDFAGDLADALSSPLTAGKTVVISTSVSCNDLTRPTNRQIRIECGGSINPASGKTFNWNSGMPSAGFYACLGGAGSHTGLLSATPAWWSTNQLANAVSAVSAGGDIFFPTGYAETISASITISKNVTLASPNKSAVTITGPNNAPLFLGSGTVTQFVLQGMTLLGGSGTSQILKVPDSPPAVWSNARVSIANNTIQGCGSYALEFGQSQYMHDIRRNLFYRNEGSIVEGWAADSVVEDNYFIESNGANPIIKTVGGAHTVYENNVFVRGAGSITAADIELNPTSSFGRGGHVFIMKNKFGPEGEIASRPKIRAYNATATNRSSYVTVIGNEFLCAASSAGGSTVGIQLDNPIYNWNISHNSFDDCEVLVNDAFAFSTASTGNGIFAANNVYMQTRTALKVFANGGRGFTLVDSPVTGDSWGSILRYEPIEVRNRLPWSENLNNWAKGTGVTTTSGQADPYGGTSAWLVDRDGASTLQTLTRAIDVTGLEDRVYLRFWAKAGTTSTVTMALRDTTAGTYAGSTTQYGLTSEWKEYTIPFNGLNTSNAHSVYVYVAGMGAVAGNFYIYMPQVSDHPSDYIPTTGSSGVVDTSISRYFNRPVKFAGGLFATLPTYADNAAATTGGLTAGRLYRTSTGDVRVVY